MCLKIAKANDLGLNSCIKLIAESISNRLLNESSGTGVTTLSVTDVFTSDFDIYKIKISCVSASEQETDLRFINSSGTIVTASNYDYGQLYLRSYASDTEIRSLVVNMNASASTLGIEKLTQFPSKYFPSPFSLPSKFFINFITCS